MDDKPKVLSTTGARCAQHLSSMKKTNSATASQKLAGSIEQVRAHLAAAETAVQAAKLESRAAKRKRKLAKEAVRRTKKRLKLAKERLAEAKHAFAEAEERLAEASSAPAEAKKRRVTRRSAKAAVSRTTKKTAKPAAPSMRHTVAPSPESPIVEPPARPPGPATTQPGEGASGLAGTE
jgi:chromosome segregation ATPase